MILSSSTESWWSLSVQEDLVNSIGQALKLGINGVVIWDDNLLSKTAESCSQVKGYVDSLLGPYVRDLLNVSRVYSRHGRPSMDGKVRQRTKAATIPDVNIHTETVLTPRMGWRIADFILDCSLVKLCSRHLSWITNQLQCLLHNRCIVNLWMNQSRAVINSCEILQWLNLRYNSSDIGRLVDMIMCETYIYMLHYIIYSHIRWPAKTGYATGQVKLLLQILSGLEIRPNYLLVRLV